MKIEKINYDKVDYDKVINKIKKSLIKVENNFKDANVYDESIYCLLTNKVNILIDTKIKNDMELKIYFSAATYINYLLNVIKRRFYLSRHKKKLYISSNNIIVICMAIYTITDLINYINSSEYEFIIDNTKIMEIDDVKINLSFTTIMIYLTKIMNKDLEAYKQNKHFIMHMRSYIRTIIKRNRYLISKCTLNIEEMDIVMDGVKYNTSYTNKHLSDFSNFYFNKFLYFKSNTLDRGVINFDGTLFNLCVVFHNLHEPINAVEQNKLNIDVIFGEKILSIPQDSFTIIKEDTINYFNDDISSTEFISSLPIYTILVLELDQYIQDKLTSYVKRMNIDDKIKIRINIKDVQGLKDNCDVRNKLNELGYELIMGENKNLLMSKTLITDITKNNTNFKNDI